MGIAEELYKATPIPHDGSGKLNIVTVLMQTPVLPTAEHQETLSHLLPLHEQFGAQPCPGRGPRYLRSWTLVHGSQCLVLKTTAD